MKHVINRSYVARLSLRIAQETRHHNFERVSKQYLDRIEHRTRIIIADEIQRQPSKGKTLK